jgi:hypothetical protein
VLDIRRCLWIFFALTGRISPTRSSTNSEASGRELLVPDVKKIEIFGHQQKVIYMTRPRPHSQTGHPPRDNLCGLARAKPGRPRRAVDVGHSRSRSIHRRMDGVEDFENLLIAEQVIAAANSSI